MTTESKTPITYRTKLGDDAMAPIAPAGTVCRYQLIEPEVIEPENGDGVFVRDAGGKLHFRQYRPQPDGGFLAVPTNPAYPTLNSAIDGLAVVAVMTGINVRGSTMFPIESWQVEPRQ